MNDEPHYLTFLRNAWALEKVIIPYVSLSFLLGHPMDFIKTQAQAQLQFQKNRPHTFLSLYSGGFPSFFRLLLRTSYRAPLQPIVKNVYRTHLPETHTDVVRVTTGLTMAVVDSILSPLERVKVWLMTNKKGETLTSFYRENKNTLYALSRDLYRGTSIITLKGAISWSSFLLAEENIHDILVKRRNLNPATHPSLTLGDQILTGIGGGVFNSFCTLPLDTVKTRLQQSGNTKPITIKSMLSVASHIIQRKGLFGFYPAFHLVVIRYALHGVIMSGLKRKMERAHLQRSSATP